MQLPLEIVVRDFDLGPSFRLEIEERARKLDQFHDRIMRCRVTVEGPGGHHLQGSCTLRLDLTVPGKEIVVSRQSGENLLEAIRETFGAAERRIQDHIRRSRRMVKAHEGPPRGRVSKLFPEKGYGFLETADGREIYFHQNSVIGAGFGRLKPGTPVRFSEEMGEKGPQASTVAILKGRPSTSRQAEPGLAVASADRGVPRPPASPGAPPPGSSTRPAPRAAPPPPAPSFERILVPLDGSLTSEAILPYLRRYFAESELILMRTADGPSPALASTPAEIADETQQYLFLTLERLVKEGWKAYARAASGPPTEAILEVARKEAPDLIAMTTHGRTGAMGQVMGSVAEVIVRTSSVPVLVVRPFGLEESGSPPPPSSETPRRILVPLNGSDASLGILSHVLVLAKEWDGQVLLLHVNPDAASEAVKPAHDRLVQIQDELDLAGIPVEWLEAAGDPLAKILELSRTGDVDLIAMASHVGPPESRLDDRSLTARVIRNVRIPIFAVRAESAPSRATPVPAIEKGRVRESKETRPARPERRKMNHGKARRARPARTLIRKTRRSIPERSTPDRAPKIRRPGSPRKRAPSRRAGQTAGGRRRGS